jgi:hypothetical protein
MHLHRSSFALDAQRTFSGPAPNQQHASMSSDQVSTFSGLSSQVADSCQYTEPSAANRSQLASSSSTAPPVAANPATNARFQELLWGLNKMVEKK